MTPADELDLIEALRQVVGVEALEKARRWNANKPYDAATLVDGATLLQSFGGLSKHARTQQRRPAPIKVDEYGFDKRGRYHADRDIA